MTPTDELETIHGRVIEALDDRPGHRVFRVQLIAAGVSKNRRRYTEAVLAAAAPLYEGAKVYDHHRSDGELESSTIAGLAGQIRAVTAAQGGLAGDLHLLPGATHAAEALDASLQAQAAGLPPLVGMSHDVIAHYQPADDPTHGRVQEATRIVRVHSVDIVADPAAGGRPIRAVASTQPESPSEEKETSMPTLDELRELLEGASAEERKALAAILGTGTTPDPTPDPAEPAEPAMAAAESWRKTSTMGRFMVKAATDGYTDLQKRVFESVLHDEFTEADLDRATMAAIAAGDADHTTENLKPSPEEPVQVVKVGKEERDRKTERLDLTFDGNFREGYRSLRHAYLDISPQASHADPIGADVPAMMLREAYEGMRRLGGYDSDGVARSLESLTTSSWGEILGDSITRRMMKDYYGVSYFQDWRKIVSDVVPVNDFRTQRRQRLGGYGTLGTVGQGAPYQALTSPTDEEATDSLDKYGGTEDLTLETFANDDLGAVRQIPRRLGVAAANTLYRGVFNDVLASNATCSYDSTALFASGHSNTTAAALSQANLATLRQNMRQQAHYGDSTIILDLLPKYLVVPPELDETAYKLTASDRALPGTEPGASDMPNINKAMYGIEAIICPTFTDANDWFLVADPALVPTIEAGFYQGRTDPELFVQDDPTVGSAFTADKITYKIRHIWYVMVLEHRGFQRGTQ